MLLPALRLIAREPEARLLLGLGIVLTLGALGGPVSGIPRCGTLLWVFISLGLLTVAERVAMSEQTQRLVIRRERVS